MAEYTYAYSEGPKGLQAIDKAFVVTTEVDFADVTTDDEDAWHLFDLPPNCIIRAAIFSGTTVAGAALFRLGDAPDEANIMANEDLDNGNLPLFETEHDGLVKYISDEEEEVWLTLKTLVDCTGKLRVSLFCIQG